MSVVHQFVAGYCGLRHNQTVAGRRRAVCRRLGGRYMSYRALGTPYTVGSLLLRFHTVEVLFLHFIRAGTIFVVLF